MQTFLPYPNYYQTALTLHPQHLGNQYYREGMTLLNGGWPNHPASKMWKGYEYSLTSYLLALQWELQNRGKWYGKTAIKLRKIRKSLKDTGYPFWLGDRDFHDGHKSKLLFKGSVFALVESLNKHFGMPYKKWKGEFYDFPAKTNQINHEQRNMLVWHCKEYDISFENWYEQFNFNEPDNLEYIWPA